MREGSLEAPVRRPLAWRDPDFTDPAKLDAEMRRVFDICHGCRRCFNLCDSFPRLFDLIDASRTGELDSVDSKDFKPVVDACTLCDMCFLTKCPYVPPHEFDLDFPHLMLRYRAMEAKTKGVPFADRELAKTDRNGKLGTLAAPLANWLTDRGNARGRALLESRAGLHREAELPRYASRSLAARARKEAPAVNREAPAFGKRKAVLYATCFGNYNDPGPGLATRAVLARNGVETEVLHPRCCGMPTLEQGLIEEVAAAAREVAAALLPWIEKGYDVVALVPSCALMLKFEWPLILPEEQAVKRLAEATFDVAEYVVDIARKEGLAPGLRPIEGGMTLHMACHARAQNMGQKAAEMLRLIPGAEVQVIERCSGHGGAWGFKKANFETALKVGRPVARQAREAGKAYVTSECPLAGVHIMQGIERLGGGEKAGPELVRHPIQLLARAYGLDGTAQGGTAP
ncbi:ferredoxin [Caldovatus sediminis]|uniref:Ferredoxin n=1 Tax=Caldovatus sediminis TaxID=2041189 RepID=A0A8J2ZDJ2_9PROT|nr:heterodisulfide reductase-related iron-sulfur binding cluster [Caldovatus sediminis]GGG44077.1 ferredoxin [Caldovatus sediminis]